MRAKFFSERYGEDNPPVKIIAEIELDRDRFEEFNSDYLAEYNFIKPYADKCVVDKAGRANCLLVLCEGDDDGVLVLTEGKNCAKHISYLPCARQIMTLNKHPSLNKQVKDMSELVKHYTEQVLGFQVNGKCAISFNSIKNYLGVEDYDVELFMDMMLECSEIETIDDSFGEYEIEIAKAYITPEEQLKELDQEEVDIICAKHILWKHDVGGEQANFSNCLLEDINLSHKDLCGAIFDKAKLVNVKLERCDQCGSTFNGTRFYDCDLTHITAEEAEFKGAKLYNCKLEGGCFTQSNFTNAKIIQCGTEGTSFQNCCIENTSFNDTDKDRIYFWGKLENEQEWLDATERNIEYDQQNPV